MDALFAVKYSYLIPLLPLIGAIISGFFGAKWLKGASHWPIWLGVGASAVLSLSLLFGMLGIWRSAEHAKGVPVPPSATKPARVAAGHAHAEPESPLAKSKDWYTWIRAGTDHPQSGETRPFIVNAGAWIDPLTAIMLCVVTGIGFLITVFSAGYMKGESGYFRFFAYLGLFIFAMTILVMGNNFIMLYLGWEGVGVCSYLLIGYYYDKPSAREAAKKAFLVNRIGDFGFALGIMLTFYIFGSVSFFGDDAVGGLKGVLNLAADHNFMSHLDATRASLVGWIPFLLMVGAFGKSAQFPLYVWLPDAMEGPTPVSALIHAATMVTAGVYMIVRCGTLFVSHESAMSTIAIVGAFTALFAATIALRQFDLKKVFAYSTISQLGYMFVAVGVLAPVAGVFHLMTHAFFKALLFLASGVVMHAMAGELDMRKMSGLKRVLPITRWVMLIGCAALAGFPFLSGFFSKDDIVGAVWDQNKALALVMLVTNLTTAYYTFRLYFRVFEGPEVIPAAPALAHGGHDDSHAHAAASDSALHAGTPESSGVDVGQTKHAPVGHDDHGGHAHNHEPALMMLPLILLAIGAVLAGYLNWPGHGFGDFLGQSPSLSKAYQMSSNSYVTEPSAFSAEAFGQEVEKSTNPATEHGPFTLVMGISTLLAVLGIWAAYVVDLKDRAAADRIDARFPAFVRLLEGKYWIDEIYRAAIVEPLRLVGRILYAIDRIVIDGIVWIIGFVIPESSGTALRLTMQRGYLQGYAATMLLGVGVILLLVFW